MEIFGEQKLKWPKVLGVGFEMIEMALGLVGNVEMAGLVRASDRELGENREWEKWEL